MSHQFFDGGLVGFPDNSRRRQRNCNDSRLRSVARPLHPPHGMKLPGVRGVAGAGLLGLALLSAVGCADDGECVPTTERQGSIYELPVADPAMRFRLESCRIDKDACLPLCQMSVGFPDLPPGAGGGFPSPRSPVLGCEVRFFDDSVTVTAYVRTYQEECIVEEDSPDFIGPPIRPPI
jgi:hypothetical protein